ncbi:type I CRISPR-associated protein Cas7 [Streptomyces globosus]|uniref:type I CRISPR-associated protein Cas7 n=1 Tax=Streptomyces globosus TaxID=68209 RepID=UPI0037FAC024
MTAAHLDPSRKQDFVFLTDITDGNPNGDPDAGGMPRLDPGTMQGLISDVAIKRKIRNMIGLMHAGRPGYDIYVESGIALNAQHNRAYEPGAAGPDATEADAQKWMCSTFYDVRMFGAVMTTGKAEETDPAEAATDGGAVPTKSRGRAKAKTGKRKTAGRVQGPIQLTLSRSIDPVTPIELGITRVTPTRIEDIGVKETEMGNKHLLPYGLFRGEGHFSAPFAQRTGVTSDDLDAFWNAFTLMFDHDRASGRASMALRGLYVFTHDNAFGRAPAHQLLDRIRVRPLGDPNARKFGDYADNIVIDDTDLPDGVTLTRLIG